MCHNYGVSVRTTIDIPDRLYQALRQTAASRRTSIRSLVIDAIELQFSRKQKGVPVLKPPVARRGKPGPRRPDRENPYDVLFA